MSSYLLLQYLSPKASCKPPLPRPSLTDPPEKIKFSNRQKFLGKNSWVFVAPWSVLCSVKASAVETCSMYVCALIAYQNASLSSLYSSKLACLFKMTKLAKILFFLKKKLNSWPKVHFLPKVPPALSFQQISPDLPPSLIFYTLRINIKKADLFLCKVNFWPLTQSAPFSKVPPLKSLSKWPPKKWPLEVF